ncbi:hypothetical protein COI41_27050 [Bacillus toyonensis]|uniref:hypothetical protein n=1 Tax=Bacillus toyonensis TaxID=155322 RepID=UPI000BF06602|nr:hypothetical protein [Bacillus toyonensis]MDF9451257.1 hypothetical protein [Bacillus toyonensis]MDG1564633.1 hypothetical protein [Bacillus toyonensis]PEO55082.1 hypothetical protein CN567_30425 [Bacillus toyonensis]PFX65737.1 hypothetical protein COL37_31435 [Bacillus toyonensis]PFX75996.1 hypothetical protein COL38_28795 [Bacillus toyonensis]
MYTDFRGKVIIKDEYKVLVELISKGSWEEENDYYTNLKDNEWSFIANLKNYRDPEHNVASITLFMNLILKEVAAHITRLKVWYGEADGPEEYFFINNDFIKKL